MRKAIVTDHSVSGNTLCDAQIWSILPHIAGCLRIFMRYTFSLQQILLPRYFLK